jgi:hypothetical protein
MESGISALFLGDTINNTVGGLLRSKDGKLDPNFDAFKNEYYQRLRSAGMTDAEINATYPLDKVAVEYFIEQHADQYSDMAESGELGAIAASGDIKRKLSGVLDTVLPRIPVLRDLHFKSGGMIDKNGSWVTGNGILDSDGVKTNPIAKRMFRDMNRRSSGLTPGQFEPLISDKQDGGAQIVLDPSNPIDSELLHPLIKVDENGNPILENGKPVALDKATLLERALGGLTVKEVLRRKKEENYIPEKGEAYIDDLGEFQPGWLSNNVLSEMFAKNKFNPEQKRIIREINRIIRDGNGGRAVMINFPATTRNKSGKVVYKPQAATLRDTVPVAITISKDGNLLFGLMSVNKLQENIQKRSQSRRGKKLYGGNVDLILRDTQAMMQFHKDGVDSIEYFSNKYGAVEANERKLFINTMFGLLNQKEQAVLNPMLVEDGVKSRDNVYRTYRADRVSKAVAMSPEDYPAMPFSYEATSQVKMPEQMRQMPETPQTAANIIALAKELDPAAFKAEMEDVKKYIQNRKDDGVPLGPVLEGDQVTLAAQKVLTKYSDDPRVIDMLKGYGEDQFSGARYMPEQVDAEYMKAVESGDVETQQRAVDEAAKAAGYNIKAYHGGTVGNVFDASRLQDAEGFFFSSDKEVASGYRPPIGYDLPKIKDAIELASDDQIETLAKEANSWADTRKEQEKDIMDSLESADADGDPEMFGMLDSYMRILGKKGSDYARLGGRLVTAYLKIDKPTVLSRQSSRGEIKTESNPKDNDGVIRKGFMDARGSGAFGDGVISTIYSVKNPNQIKSADPITRDKSNNIIPPSKRFDQTTDDIRYMPEKASTSSEEVIVDKGDKDTLDVIQATGKDGKLKFKDGKPVASTVGYNLASAPHIEKFAGNVEDVSTKFLDEIPYNLNNAERGRVEALIKNGVVDNLANDMAKDTNIVLNNPAIAAGKGWYSRMRVKLLNAPGEEGRELFSQLLGATSAQTPVDENFQQAVDAYEGIKKGRYNRHRKGYLTAIRAESKGKLNEEIVKSRAVEKIKDIISNLNDAIPSAKKADKVAINDEIRSLTNLIERPVDNRTPAQRIKLYVVGNDLLPRRSNGAKFNANSGAVLKVISGVWLENLDAPKTPNFAGNLSGRTTQATIDIWAARYIRRQIYGGEGKPWRIQPKSEVGVSNEDFALSQVIMQRAAKKLGMNPDDLQAVLWFAEKDVWDKNKWTKNEGAKKSSFDDIFEVFFPEGRKPLTFKEGFDFLKKKKELEKDIEQKEKKAIIKAEAEALGISISALMKMKKAKKQDEN